jgi:hypothetical protein
VESTDWFKVNHAGEITKSEIQETIMNDSLGHLNKNKIKVVSCKIKTDGFFQNYDDDVNVSGLDELELIVRYLP